MLLIFGTLAISFILAIPLIRVLRVEGWIAAFVVTGLWVFGLYLLAVLFGLSPPAKGGGSVPVEEFKESVLFVMPICPTIVIIAKLVGRWR